MSSTYTDLQFELNYPEGIDDYYWTIARNKIIHSAIKKAGLSKNKLLEVGCGRGAVVAHMAAKGLNIFGIELAETTPIAEANGLILTKKNALDVGDNFAKKFDTLLLLDVIEHIEKPEEFIASLLHKYINVTKLIITVPAREDIWSNYDEVFGHYRRYDLGMMQKTIENLDFEAETISYFFHSLYYPAKLLLKLFKQREVRVTPPKGLAKITHKILSMFFVAEYHFLPKNLAGTSILCIASKNNTCVA